MSIAHPDKDNSQLITQEASTNKMNLQPSQEDNSTQQTNQPASEMLPTPTITSMQSHETTTSTADKHAGYDYVDHESVSKEDDVSKCEICDASFAKKFNMHRHMRVKHGVNILKKKDNIQQEKTARPFKFVSDVNNDMYICARCDVPFIQKSERDAHYLRHNKVKVYNCNICLKPFKNKTAKNT